MSLKLFPGFCSAFKRSGRCIPAAWLGFPAPCLASFAASRGLGGRSLPEPLCPGSSAPVFATCLMVVLLLGRPLFRPAPSLVPPVPSAPFGAVALPHVASWLLLHACGHSLTLDTRAFLRFDVLEFFSALAFVNLLFLTLDRTLALSGSGRAVLSPRPGFLHLCRPSFWLGYFFSFSTRAFVVAPFRTSVTVYATASFDTGVFSSYYGFTSGLRFSAFNSPPP